MYLIKIFSKDTLTFSSHNPLKENKIFFSAVGLVLTIFILLIIILWVSVQFFVLRRIPEVLKPLDWDDLEEQLIENTTITEPENEEENKLFTIEQ